MTGRKKDRRGQNGGLETREEPGVTEQAGDIHRRARMRAGWRN